MKRAITFTSLLGFVSVSVFVATESIAAAAAAIWSVSGLFHFGTFGTAILSVIVGIPTLYAIIKSTILAFEAETDPENN